MSLFPLARFERIDNLLADRSLVAWGHWLGACDRPFGHQSFGLFLGDDLVSIAVSASTVNAVCGGWPRTSVVELARQCSAPTARWATRVCLRLWREVAAREWSVYWAALALVSYSNSTRHAGDIYRFDGWTCVAAVRGGTAGGNWTRGKRYDPKRVWVYVLGDLSDAARRDAALARTA